MSPLIRLLRIVDSDEKPAMGYVYDGIYRVIDGIKKNFKDKKRLQEPYVNIIKDQWDNQFYRDIHAAAYRLNPAFQYDSSTLNKRLETQFAVTNVIESKVSVGRLKLVEELRLFREREQTFETQLAQESANTSQLGKILFTLTNNKMKICFKDHSFFLYFWDKYSYVY